jgi:hypothetical protein
VPLCLQEQPDCAGELPIQARSQGGNSLCFDENGLPALFDDIVVIHV